jgi:hypothetical protein
MVLLTILGVLFISLIVIIPLIEKFGPRPDNDQLNKIRRWILPVFGLMLLIQLIFYIVS